MQRREFCQGLLGALGAGLISPISARAAQAYPRYPVRVVVPYAAGGGPDIMMRQFGPTLGKALGQSVIVENKVGAAGVLAAEYVAQSPADGYTVLLGSNSHLIQKALQPALKFDPVKDFAPVTVIGTSPSVLVVAASSPYRSVQDLIAALRARPGKMNYGSGGIGSAAHLGGATFVTLLGLKAVHIPFKGSVEIPISLLRGDTDFAFTIAGTAIPQVQSGKLRALAVTGQAPMAELPGVPTLNSLLHNDLAIQEFWFGLWLPRKAPANVIDTLYRATVAALRDPSVKGMFASLGVRVIHSASPQSFAQFVQAESAKWTQVVKLAGITAG
ncbi:MAG: Bug family tripartite tricarboxylate transporter substrate binding protein [Bordetella sp.]|uniref:Bug family tripartite tricarboxylate transporter substrate binding protein n=1 Tax=Bordetella sp. TaxID=28081 RepID=UPI003F7C188B